MMLAMKIAFLILTVALISCNNQTSRHGGETVAKATFDPCESLRQLDPHCGWKPHWDDSGISTNAIDGTKTEFLSIESTDTDGASLTLSYGKLRICFENGKLCGNKSVGVGVTVHGMVQPMDYDSEYSTPVRVKFDDDRPSRQTWGIADSHDALFPHGREELFLLQLLAHKKLILEFSYYERAPRTLTFEISGLEDKMKSIGVDVRGQVAHKEAAQRAKVEPQINLCKNRNFPTEFCWEPADGSGPWGPFATREVATKYAIERYRDHLKVP
jgi:hypothetical protein